MRIGLSDVASMAAGGRGAVDRFEVDIDDD